MLLGSRRDGTSIGAPDGDAETRPGDAVVRSGTGNRIRELAGHEAGGDAAHEDAVAEHEGVLEQERRLGARP